MSLGAAPNLAFAEASQRRSLRKRAVAGVLLPELAVRVQHRHLEVDARGAGVLVAQAALGVVPPLGVAQLVGLDVGNDDDAVAEAEVAGVGLGRPLEGVDAVPVGVLEADVVRVEQREQLGGDVAAQVAALDDGRRVRVLDDGSGRVVVEVASGHSGFFPSVECFVYVKSAMRT